MLSAAARRRSASLAGATASLQWLNVPAARSCRWRNSTACWTSGRRRPTPLDASRSRAARPTPRSSTSWASAGRFETSRAARNSPSRAPSPRARTGPASRSRTSRPTSRCWSSCCETAPPSATTARRRRASWRVPACTSAAWEWSRSSRSTSCPITRSTPTATTTFRWTRRSTRSRSSSTRATRCRSGPRASGGGRPRARRG
mmetsp:Transcript_18202/g.54122  ORF Transcript_18202/g.54122 Transcript_18202/m.54122 type:complete len:202 (+) Transcript_18202:441-1046(+)